MTALSNETPPRFLIPATLPMGINKGKQTRKVLLNPATGEHFCALCDFSGPTFHHVLGHKRTAHPSGRGKVKPAVDSAGWDAVHRNLAAAFASIDSAVQAIREIQDVDPAAEWKKRALAAERSLKSLRKILGTESDA